MFHRKSSKTPRPNSSVRFFDLSPRQGPLVGIPPKAFNPLERAGRVRRRDPIGKMRTLWLPPLASEPNSLHGVWSRVVREPPDGRGLRQLPRDRFRATPGVHFGASVAPFALSHGLLMGVLRPLGLDIHLPRTRARCIGSTVRP